MKELKISGMYWSMQTMVVRANGTDTRAVDKERKRVTVIKMSCPLMDNISTKHAEKISKYGALRWELKQQYSG